MLGNYSNDKFLARIEMHRERIKRKEKYSKFNSMDDKEKMLSSRRYNLSTVRSQRCLREGVSNRKLGEFVNG